MHAGGLGGDEELAGDFTVAAPGRDEPQDFELPRGEPEPFRLGNPAVTGKSGRAAARGGDWQQASATLSAADALWRGTPFADIPSRPIRDAYVPYLQELRLAAQETRIDADLRLAPSRAADVVPELQELSRQHPERERFRAQLMLALYRCGRQADALAVYQRARQFSISELGMEPGADLQETHRRILTADQALLPGQLEAGTGYLIARRT